MRSVFGTLFVYILMAPVWGQNQPEHPARTMTAYRLTGPVRIDGHLSEAIWEAAPETDFIQRDPIEGDTPSQRTEVIVGYDDHALYIGARLYDAAPDSITQRLARRDDDVSSDQFLMGIDPWLDHRSGFYFVVNASGSIQDGTLFNDNGGDDSWDGVWESSVQLTGFGWTVEIRIPFSQLRFPNKSEHVWGINFARFIERQNEYDMYVFTPKTANARVSWFAHLTGIKNIKRPRYVELLPYTSGKSDFSHPAAGNPFNDGSLYSGQLGLDLKVGLTSSITLDATLNPDFGQVEVDPAVVNLSDFETFFPEKRPFFIEGRDIFRFGRGGVNNNWTFNYGDPTQFYSRRVGRAPQGSPTHDYDYSDTPNGTTILGAAKISGKVTPEWSFGVISALTGREYTRLDLSGVRYSDEVEPMTSYNVIRARREFAEGRHGLGMISSYMSRDLRTDNLRDLLSSSALNVGLDGWVTLDKDRTYVLTGWFGRSQVTGSPAAVEAVQRSSPHYYQRPDVDHLGVDASATQLSGYAGRLYVNKQKGNIIFNSGFAMVAPGYAVNDMGFQWNADQINWHITGGYRSFDIGKYFRSTFFALATFNNWDFGGNRYGAGYFLFSEAQMLNYWSVFLNGGINPETLNKNRTRGGVLTIEPSSRWIQTGIQSDSRKEFSFAFRVMHGRATRVITQVNPEITWKPTTTMSLSFSPSYTYDVTEANWVGMQEDALATATAGTRYLYAETVQKSFSMGSRLNWTFSPTLSLQLYVEPLIFAIDYFDYKELAAASSFNFKIYGQAGESTITETSTDDDIVYEVDPDGPGAAQAFDIEDRDFNFKSLRGNLVLRWEYRPGSVFYFAWTQNRTDIASTGLFNFGSDARDLLNASSDNIFLIKFTYWLAP